MKPRRVRAVAMTIQYGVRGMILAVQSKAFKQENILAERLHGLDWHMEKKEDESLYFMDPDGQSEHMSQNLEVIMRARVIDFGSSYHLSIWCAPFKALYGRKCRSHVLWVEIGDSSLTGLKLVQETTNKVVLIKEKLKAVKDRPKELCWIGLVADRLRLPKELSCVHDTFHVSNLKKKCFADASLHVPLDEIKVDKTLRFVEEPVENSDHEVKRLKCNRMVVVKAKLLAVRYLVKVSWNSKCNFELTWVWEDYLKDKYPRLIVFVLVFVEAAKHQPCVSALAGYDNGYVPHVPRKVGLRVDVEDIYEPYTDPNGDSDIQVDIDACIAFADDLRARGTDDRVVVETVAEEEVESSVRGMTEVAVDLRVRPVIDDDVRESAREDVFDHVMDDGAVKVIESEQRLQGHRITGVDLEVTTMTERISALERDNTRLRGMLNVKSQRVDRIQRSLSRVQRKLRQIRRFQFYDRVRLSRLEACARRHLGYRH
ncbi:hypothetical protein Tco_1158922 [Tanacetum coccineum]